MIMVSIALKMVAPSALHIARSRCRTADKSRGKPFDIPILSNLVMPGIKNSFRFVGRMMEACRVYGPARV